MDETNIGTIFRFSELIPTNRIVEISQKSRDFNQELLFCFFNYCSGNWSESQSTRITLRNRKLLRFGKGPVSAVFETSEGDIRFFTDAERTYTCVMFEYEKTC